jgi:cytochrome c oxidase subunit II
VRKRSLWWRLAPLGALGLGSCGSDSPSPLQPAGPFARALNELWWLTFFFGAIVFLVVVGLLCYAIWRYRDRGEDDGEPAQLYGNTRLELAWTALPALLLVMLLVLTVETMAATRQPAEAALRVQAIGHQWWWEVTYPDYGIVSAAEVHIPVGVPVAVEISSVDVIHSFWVPELAGKTDAVPGRTNVSWIQADEPGEFWAQCAEYCGTQHANMNFLVVAHPQEEFDAWLAQHSRPLAPELLPENGDPIAQSFVRCVGCHAISGSQVARGQTGPNLTNFGSRRTIASGTLENTPENLARWLRDPNEVKPGNLMGQAVQKGTLSEEQIAQLVNYLMSLK